MALFIPSMACRLCGQPMNKEEKLVMFSPFIASETDPLWFFSDGIFHEDCLRKHPQGTKAIALHDELLKRTSPQNRCCSITGQLITNPDRYLSTGVLASDPSDPLYRFNFAQFDRAALANWSERKTLETLLSEALSSGRMKGKGVAWLLRQIENPQAGLTSATH
jgi:hypothetical protein